MLQVLAWIGFRTPIPRQSLIDDAFEDFQAVGSLTEKDISNMASDFGGRTVANGRIIFGTRRTKLLQALTHWVRDFYRVSGVPTIVGLNEYTFKTALNTALAREDIRVNMAKLAKVSAEAASPGPLESERMWKQWEEQFTNYTRSHIGVNGIPLSYIIRENDAPDVDGEYNDFVSKTIACAPLTGEYFTADSMTVFNMIVSFTTGQPSGDWIKSTLRQSNGRVSMKALRDHFTGEGNATRNMAEADRLQESLHYKSERSMTFETFLTQCQKMYNIFEKEGEPMSDEAKVRFLYKKVQHPGLRNCIEALKAQQISGTNVTYTMAANHLSTAVSELPEFISKNRSISAIGSGGNESKLNPDILKADGSINLGYIPKWRSLSEEDKEIVMAERKRRKSKKGKGTGTQGPLDAAAQKNRMNQLAEQNKKYKRQIKALKRAPPDDDEDKEDSESDTDAGDQFGGKAAKKKGKKASKRS